MVADDDAPFFPIDDGAPEGDSAEDAATPNPSQGSPSAIQPAAHSSASMGAQTGPQNDGPTPAEGGTASAPAGLINAVENRPAGQHPGQSHGYGGHGPSHGYGQHGRNNRQQRHATHYPPNHTGNIPTLEHRCVRQFARIALGRGREYFRNGRVNEPIWSTENDKICNVQINGTGGAYQLSFDFSKVSEDRSLPVTCDCPAYVRGVLCKHIWAAILQIDKSNPPGPECRIPESPALKLIHSQPRPMQQRQQHENQPRPEGGGHPHQHRRQDRPTIAPAIKIDPHSWSHRLAVLQGTAEANPNPRNASARSHAYFVVSAPESLAKGRLIVDLWIRNRMISGEFGPLMASRVMGQDFHQFEDSRDRDILRLLTKSCEPKTFSPFGRSSGKMTSRFTVDPLFESHLLNSLATSGRLFLSRSPNGSPDSAERPIRMDRGKAWDLTLKVETAGLDYYRLDGQLRRDHESRTLTDAILILKSGFLVFEDRIAKFAESRHAQWAAGLKEAGEFLIPRADGDGFLAKVLTDPSAPKIIWPDEMGWSLTTLEPKPKGVFRPLGNDPSTGRMTLTVSFDYAGREIPLSETKTSLVDVASKRVLQRNRDFEEQTLLKALEILRDPQGTGTVPTGDMHRAANELVAAGWTVYVENQKLVAASDFSFNVSSNTDWFDLKLEASFGGAEMKYQDLLKALENKSGMVQLSDGSLGMLPKDFLERFAQVSQFGQATGDGSVRFAKSQGLMLNAAIGEGVPVTADSSFMTFREKIRQFEGVKTADAPEGFNGKLREYQREGLTWLKFLEEFEAGGILADDMGLGKTIQILAFLQSRARKNKMPSLVVTPKSLAFNWIDEAAKFVPHLKLVRYSGAGRKQRLSDLQKSDLVVTTYGAVRTDIEKLEGVEFDIAIIDEAQAIKNPKAQSTQAVKRLRAQNRLALTGTPIENSINDLLSILEFTNPGLINQKELKADLQATLARMLKPFMLRRTKEKVLTELPDKSEQVLYCEMSVEEKEFYNAIRDRYRASIAEKVARSGIGRNKLHVLEALLRLRQAASHPGLIDPEKIKEPSAKLQQLLNHVQEVTQENHKCLIFSQFTSLLAIVRPMLDEAGIKYEYLDGQTEDRKSPVERFQTDPDCKVFLISLKAGGTGLNLTAADYVFILDPWWNPAVEAQAIGRAHRMGQTQKVIAYRMIAQGTVEEKILELQKTKKDLAESIVSEDQDFLKKLTKEDLEMILA